MVELAPTLPLREKICEALLGTQNKERCLLHWLECHEHGDWIKCDSIAHTYCLDQDDLILHYAEAVVWADEVLLSAS
jgi:c-di-GMP-related signal transduction protein